VRMIYKLYGHSFVILFSVSQLATSRDESAPIFCRCLCLSNSATSPGHNCFLEEKLLFSRYWNCGQSRLLLENGNVTVAGSVCVFRWDEERRESTFIGLLGNELVSMHVPSVGSIRISSALSPLQLKMRTDLAFETS
jgi:hypothetical protein